MKLSERDKNIAGVIRPTDSRLLWGVMHNLTPRDGGKTQRWVVVRDVFAVGSTSAIALCREFDLDPDELLDGPECEYCNESEKE